MKVILNELIVIQFKHVSIAVEHVAGRKVIATVP